MKKLTVALFLMLTSLSSVAEEYLGFYFFQHVRIVLSTELDCDNGMSGKKAVAQRMDGMYTKGCWYLDHTKEELLIKDQMVHIDWDKGDFTELELSRFEIVKDKNNNIADVI